ncbi:hypothetical protein [Streptomyces dysideae]|nr:hypothetical protein [Streptomyces dysideae]
MIEAWLSTAERHQLIARLASDRREHLAVQTYRARQPRPPGITPLKPQ